MLWKCCTKYASKFGKLGSSHSTGKGQFSLQSQRKAMPNIVQTTHLTCYQSNAQHSPSQASTVHEPWFPEIQLDLEKAEEPETKLPTSIESSKSKRVPEKKNISALLTAKGFDFGDHSKLWKLLKEMGLPDHVACLRRSRYASQEATVRTGTIDWFQIGKGVCQGCILPPCLFNLYAE